MHQTVSRKDRKEDGAQISDSPKHDSKEHHRKERLHQTDELTHDTDTAAAGFPALYDLLFTHDTASFPYCSNSICDRYRFA